ncbi:unnamed protein product [Ranitomeya imitator]|uniref:Uncharacterized protein n=1 Tax=Ranitomeya imitator TaxID=111125 RepID=A0ABN9KRJ3_9NEOB|nr:unnamed protein product [Ranitomeya imitator]
MGPTNKEMEETEGPNFMMTKKKMVLRMGLIKRWKESVKSEKNQVNTVKRRISVQPQRQEETDTLLEPMTQRGTCQGVTKTLNFRKAKFDQLRDALNLVDWDNILRNENTDNKWEMFKNILNRQCKRFIPCGNKRTRNRKNPMWLNKEVRQAINSKKKAFALLKQDGTIEALKNYREKNTLSKKLIKAAKKETEKHIAKESKTNPKLFFNYINSKRIKTENVGPLKNSEERMVVDDEEKANILNTFFSTVFTVENEMLGEIPRNNENPILRVTNLTQEEVRNRLNKIKIDKSPGPDGIHPRVLRELSNLLEWVEKTLQKHDVYTARQRPPSSSQCNYDRGVLEVMIRPYRSHIIQPVRDHMKRQKDPQKPHTQKIWGQVSEMFGTTSCQDDGWSPNTGDGGDRWSPDTDDGGDRWSTNTGDGGNGWSPDTDDGGDRWSPNSGDGGNGWSPDTDDGGDRWSTNTGDGGNGWSPDADDGVEVYL